MSQSRFMEILKRVGSEIGAEAKRMFELGQSEAANGLFHGHGFVLYGPNQRPAAGEKAVEQPEPAVEPPEQTHGRSM
jgi:hypothetical protein